LPLRPASYCSFDWATGWIWERDEDAIVFGDTDEANDRILTPHQHIGTPNCMSEVEYALNV
jgi:hypothetical protein